MKTDCGVIFYRPFPKTVVVGCFFFSLFAAVADQTMITCKKIKDDLYFRLQGVSLHLSELTEDG